MKFSKKLLLPVFLISPLVLSSGTFDREANSSNSNTVNVTFQLDDGAIFPELSGTNTYTITVKKSLTWKYAQVKAPTAKDITFDKDHTFSNWQYLDTSVEPAVKKDMENDYSFENDVTLYSKFIDSSVTLTFALPDTPKEVKQDYELPAESARFSNGTIWDNVKSSYIPKMKSGVSSSLVYFVNYVNKDNQVLGTDIGTSSNPLKPSMNLDFTATFKSVETSDFATDSWDIFIAAAEKGFTAMSTTAEGSSLGYKKAFEDNGNTFVGLTRKINIANKDYTVRVIGEKADTIDEKKAATLTFEFAEIITDARSYASSFNVTNEWERSALRKSLNKGGDLFAILPQNIQNAIKPVSKSTYRGNGAESSDIITTTECLFPLSLSEIGFSGTIGDAAQPVLTEGSVYKYYYNQPTYRQKKYGDNNISYYLRSPQLDISVCSWYIDSSNTASGEPKKAYDVSKGLGIAPAFCIGETTIV